MDRLGIFLQELRRRRIYRAATIYLVVAWGATEAVAFFLEKLPFPTWSIPVLAIAFVVGFPATMLLAWHFDITADGIRSTPPASAKGELTIVLAVILLIGGTAGLFHLIYPDGVIEGKSVAALEPFDPPAHSVAVLPFVDLSQERNQEYLASGLAETLLHQLAQVRNLHVIARTSSFAPVNRSEEIGAIGRRLNVGTVLRGSVQKAGGTLRITAQLINTVDSSHIWSETFDRLDADIFDIQDQIAATVTGALLDTFDMNDVVRSAEHLTSNLEAYDLFLLGRHFWHQRTEESLRRSIDLFEQAISLDPEFALAYAALADAYGVLPDYGDTSIDDIAELAETAVRRAFEIDENLSEAHASIGLIRLQQERYVEADYEFEQSISLQPGYAMAHIWYARSLYLQRRYKESVPVARKARQLDPLSAVIGRNLAMAYFWNGDFQNANREYERAVELSPSYIYGYIGLGGVSRIAGKFDDAVRQYRLAVELDPSNLLSLRELAWAYLGLADDERADYWLSQAENQDPLDPYVTFGRKLYFTESGQAAAFIEYTQANLDRTPDDSFLIADAALAYVLARNFSAAVELYAQVRSRERKFSQPLFDHWQFMYGNFHALALVKAYQETGEFDEAAGLAIEIEEYLALAAEQGLSLPNRHYFLACLHALRGNESGAVDELQRAYDRGWRAYRVAMNDPTLESLQDNRRFLQILSRARNDVSQMQEVTLRAYNEL